MLQSIQFRNFKVLRDATLPLGRFTLIVGPNGSGKSTALQALQVVAQQRVDHSYFRMYVTAGLPISDQTTVEVAFNWASPYEGLITKAHWSPNSAGLEYGRTDGRSRSGVEVQALYRKLQDIRVFSLDAKLIVQIVSLEPRVSFNADGSSTAGVLDRLRDLHPERFEALNEELSRWLPEYDRVLFDVPSHGQRSFLLRTRDGRHAIPAADLSQGTLFALFMLTLAYLPDPPPVIGLEEPDRGIHPRLLRRIQDAIYRLCYPDNFGESREPVQVIATTHSPYFLDLFRDHPEEIVIAEKVGNEARFERLMERPDIEEILAEAPLGEVWFSGVLGGVPAQP